jgi:Ca2+-binding RTX toxin-like protein
VSRADFVVGIAESSEHLAIMGAGFAFGGSGNDIIFAPNTADTIDGGAGINTLDYSLLTNPVVNVDLTAGTAVKSGSVTDHLTNIQNVVGTSGADTLSGNSAANTLTGGGGADAFRFKGAFGADIVTDFQAAGSAHDLLQFDAAAFSTASAALAAAHQVGADVVINNGANSVTLKGINVSTLTTADFRIQ